MARELSSHAAAARMIRIFMREQGIAGQVRANSYSGGSSVNVYVEDLPPEQYRMLSDYAQQFQYGHFDGMIDLYEYSNNRDDIPQVRFVFVNNRMSDAMEQKIWDFLRNRYSGMENAPVNVNDAKGFPVHGEYSDRIIYRFFSGGYNQNYFWDFVNGVEELIAA